MSRKNVDHTSTSLFALAEEIHRAAEMIEGAAKRLRSAKHVKTISVAHQAPIELGLQAVPRFVDDIDRKIKFAGQG